MLLSGAIGAAIVYFGLFTSRFSEGWNRNAELTMAERNSQKVQEPFKELKGETCEEPIDIKFSDLNEWAGWKAADLVRSFTGLLDDNPEP